VLGWMAERGRRKAALLDCRSLAVETYSWGRVGARLEALYREVATTGLLAHQRTPAAAF
jgi:glycosyltransferase involved in cell wall biosynthesis